MAALFVAALIIFVVACVLWLRAPLLHVLGDAAGVSRRRAVALGWVVWTVPLVGAAVLVRKIDRRQLGSGSALLMLAAFLLLLAPGIALSPGRSTDEASVIAHVAHREAPAVAGALLAGVAAGFSAVSLAALLAVATKRWPRLRFGALVLVPLVALVCVEVLAGKPPQGASATDLFSPDRSFTINGKNEAVRVSLTESSCADGVRPAAAARALSSRGCGRVIQAVFRDTASRALAEVSVVAMPDDQLARTGEHAVVRLSARPAPLAPFDRAPSRVLLESLDSEIVLLAGTSRVDSKAGTAAMLSLMRSVAFAVQYGITGVP